MMDGPHLELPPPDLAIAFAGDLLELRSRYLADALGDAVRHGDVATLDGELLNAAGREVSIVLGSDPDIKIQEQLAPGVFRTQVSIEIKGGTDRSNIYNRIGEAEKSHLTAKQRDCTEFWTIVNVPSLDQAKAKLKPPTTTRFYQLQQITRGKDVAPGPKRPVGVQPALRREDPISQECRALADDLGQGERGARLRGSLVTGFWLPGFLPEPSRSCR